MLAMTVGPRYSGEIRVAGAHSLGSTLGLCCAWEPQLWAGVNRTDQLKSMI